MGKHYDNDGDGIADRDGEDKPFLAPRAQGESAAAIMTRYGLVNVPEIITAAQLEGLELAAACACITKESGGRNVWGSDGVSTGGAYVKGSPVTESAYKKYRALVQAGSIGRQGVGPCQCTSKGYQDTADQLGGCWLPVPNMRSGFRGLKGLIQKYGPQGGAQRYNGSGPAAVAYGKDFLNKYNTWKSRLAGASVPTPAPIYTNASEDDVGTPQENATTLLNTLLNDPYAADHGQKHQMNVADQLAWACAHAAYARESSAKAVALLAGLQAAVDKLADSVGRTSGVDPAALKAAVSDAIQESVVVTGQINIGPK